MDFSHFKTQKIELGDYDLRSENIIKMALFNTIDRIGIGLELVINDKTDIKNKSPIKGGEKLSIIFTDRYDNKLKKDLILTNVENLDSINDWNNVIQLSFVTKDSYIMSTKRDYSYHNGTISDIIKKYGEFTDTTPTTEIRDVVIPGFTYTKAIQYMISNFTKSHICYEANENYVFTDIEDLLVVEEVDETKTSTKEQEEKTNNTKETKTTAEEAEEKDADTIYRINYKNPHSRYGVLSWKEVQVFNTINDGYKNIYDNTYISYDPSTKTVVSSRKTIDTEEKEVTRLGTGPSYNEDIIENVNTKFSIKPYSEKVLENSSNTYDLFNKKLELLMNGDLNIQIGALVDIEIRDKFNNDVNNTTNGQYIVTKLAHHIDQKEFLTKVEVSKNAFFKEIVAPTKTETSTTTKTVTQ